MISSEITSPDATTDAALVEASLAGNREAFSQIVTRHQSLVCSLAYSATGSLTQSEDLAQETFLAAWKKLSGLREPGKLRAWLCGIARNVINNFLRAQGREPSHRAEALEDMAEPTSAEPLPTERAISREEADILWRSLERIPEIYREPLVLFYRQQQSVEMVARDLELSEEAVRQRLARGRKLLQEEVLAFVEGSLAKSGPGKAFTVAVVAALPLAAVSAKAATVGAAVAKGGAAAKGVFSLTALGGMAGLVGGALFSWKTAVDESKSEPERRLMVRTAWFQIGFFTVSLGATFWLMPRLGGHPVVMVILLGLILLANLVNGVSLQNRFQRRMEIVMEEGIWADATWSGPDEETNRQATRKAARLVIPFIIMFAFGAIGLPWKQHLLRAAVITAGEALIVFWAYRRFQKMLSGQWMAGVKGAWLPAPLRHPIILLPLIIFGSSLLGVGLLMFMNPGDARILLHDTTWLRNMGLALLGAAAGYAIFAAIYMRKRGIVLSEANGLDTSGETQLQADGGKPAMGSLLVKTLAMTTKMMGPLMGKMMVKAYEPVFGRLSLGEAQRAQLEELISKKNQVNMDKGLALMDAKLETGRRAAAIEEMKKEREDCDAEIQGLLGVEKYEVFAQFERSLSDRMIMGAFTTKCARTGMALSGEQQERLLEMIAAARAQFPWSTDMGRRLPNPPDPAGMFSGENIAIFAREEEDLDRQVVEEASIILTAEQYATFGPFLARQRRAKIASMKMTGKMFRPGG